MPMEVISKEQVQRLKTYALDLEEIKNDCKYIATDLNTRRKVLKLNLGNKSDVQSIAIDLNSISLVTDNSIRILNSILERIN